jgi:glycosyltransferase involved in cell wall biosynthesis
MVRHGTIVKILASPYREFSETNPVLSLLYESLEKSGVHVSGFSRRKLLRESWNVWHLHWPTENIVGRKYARDVIPRLLIFWMVLKAARFKRIKIFWTAHNIRPHEQNHPFLERVFWRIFLSNIDGIICMSQIGKQELFRHHPQTQSIPIFTIPHGHYRGAYPDEISKGKARTALGLSLDDFVILFIGQIRAYKGISTLIRCFAESRLTDTKLLVAGMANDEMALEIKKAAALSSNIKLVFEFVKRDDVQKYLRAADLVVLPYVEILNSGSAILALSFDRPILVPARGALAELGEIIGSDWVKLYEGELSPEIVRTAVQWAKSRAIHPDAHAPLDALDWDHIARLTIEAFS